MAENHGAVENALQNPLILQNIFRNSNSSDLLACRLVNRLNWFGLAMDVLCEKKEIKIDLDFSNNFTKAEFFRAFETPNENPWSLKSLVKCIKQSHFFPCCRFRFSQVYFDDDDEDLLEFFSIYGESVIDLEIDLMDRTNVSSVIGKFGEILWKKLPNLEKLTIWKVSLGWSSSSRLFSKQVRPATKLQNLKYLNFEESLGNRNYKFIQDIQDAAPNLETSNVQAIPFVPPKTPVGSDLIEFVSERNEIKLSLTFFPQNSNIQFYERLVRAKAKFSRININLIMVRINPEVRILSRVTGTLTEILKLSQSSLSKLDEVTEILSLPEIPLDSFVFPHILTLELWNLKTRVKIQSASEEKQNQDKDDDDKNDENASTLNLDLKPTWKISQSFPSLSEVSLESLDFIHHCHESIETVKILKSNADFSSAGDFQKLGEIFPNVEDLHLSSIKNFQECAGSLWKNLGKVAKLKMKIWVEKPEDVSMDTAFLGTETTSSILELGDLKTLVVTFTPIPQETGSENGNGTWTHWKFLQKPTLIQLHSKLKQLKSISVLVDATRTDCTNKGEIYKQLRKLEPFAAVRVDVDPQTNVEPQRRERRPRRRT